MRSSRINFGTVGICITQNISGKFNDHTLHSHTDTESWDIIFACKL